MNSSNWWWKFASAKKLDAVVDAIETQWARLRIPRCMAGGGASASDTAEVPDLGKQFGPVRWAERLEFALRKGAHMVWVGPSAPASRPHQSAGEHLTVAGRAARTSAWTRVLSPGELAPLRLSLGEPGDARRPDRRTLSRLPEELLSRYLGSHARTPMLRDFQLPFAAVRDLSHGMRLEMALIFALPYRPRLMILDEPFTGLDPLVRDELVQGLLQIRPAS